MTIKRPIKMLVYGDPGTGKSVFASKFPKPFFICSDGNYEWLEDFGANPDAHADISSYAEFEKLALTSNFDGYETIVVDLIEDVYKWNESEFCKKMGVDHLSDAGGFGKGWDITRTRFFTACSKLISRPKNVIFLSHASNQVRKDKRGNESTYYMPSGMMSEKFLTMLEGRLRYVLHAFIKEEIKPDGKTIKHRILSLVPGVDEYGIIRGVNTDFIPNEIPLDANIFLETVGYEKDAVKAEASAPVKEEPKIIAPAPVKAAQASSPALVKETQVPVKEEPASVEVAEEKTTVIEEEVKVASAPIKPEPVQSPQDKIAAIKAKLAAMSKK
jgi:hypothetical protein